MAAKEKPLAGFGVVHVPSQRERDQYIAAVVNQWEKEIRQQRPAAEAPRPFVTISRQYGCMAVELGMRLAGRLNEHRGPSDSMWTVYDREIVQRIADDLHISQRLIELLTEHSRARLTEYLDTCFQKRPTKDTIVHKMVHTVRGLCEKGYSIIIGRGGSIIGAGSPWGFHVRIVAPAQWRINQVAEVYEIPREEAEKRVRLIDKERERFTLELFGRDVSDTDLYDLVINESRFSMDQMVSLILTAMEMRGILSGGAR
jgi:cytidylate kinase